MISLTINLPKCQRVVEYYVECEAEEHAAKILYCIQLLKVPGNLKF